jgi:hypothetical protein
MGLHKQQRAADLQEILLLSAREIRGGYSFQIFLDKIGTITRKF